MRFDFEQSSSKTDIFFGSLYTYFQKTKQPLFARAESIPVT
jgi:hypothetical protein